MNRVENNVVNGEIAHYELIQAIHCHICWMNFTLKNRQNLSIPTYNKSAANDFEKI